MAPPTTPEIDRFWMKVDKAAGGCWLWTGGKLRTGYGRFAVGSRSDNSRRMVMAHRWSYEQFVGPIEDGLTIDHLCRNRACVNPDHLEAATGKVNILRGVGAPAKNAKRKTCQRGHRLAGKNLKVLPDGRRQCKACRRDRNRKRDQQQARREWTRKYQRSEKRKAYKRGWQQENREHINAYMRERRRKQREDATPR